MQKPYPAKMRRLWHLVVRSYGKNRAEQEVRPATRRMSLCRGYRFGFEPGECLLRQPVPRQRKFHPCPPHPGRALPWARVGVGQLADRCLLAKQTLVLHVQQEARHFACYGISQRFSWLRFKQVRLRSSERRVPAWSADGGGCYAGAWSEWCEVIRVCLMGCLVSGKMSCRYTRASSRLTKKELVLLVISARGAFCRKLTFLLRIEVWFVERSEAPNRNGQKSYPAKMRHLRLLVVLSTRLYRLSRIGPPGKAKDEPCWGYRLC